ncbi:MAG: hypothetical protein BVN30_08405 [Proteobacteria bacterium ST_bin16]|nr:MAG: hypothetical protein BVN30_08405 [Proteobacteria bacterium ST_bin16]
MASISSIKSEKWLSGINLQSALMEPPRSGMDQEKLNALYCDAHRLAIDVRCAVKYERDNAN